MTTSERKSESEREKVTGEKDRRERAAKESVRENGERERQS